MKCPRSQSFHPRRRLLFALVGLACTLFSDAAATSGVVHLQRSASAAERRVFREVRRFSAPEARQGVAVDERSFYAIGDRAIGKYDKRNGTKVAEWRAPEGGPIQHLNSGSVVGGRLYCAHSNYPNLPMASSIEIFEITSLRHVASHSFAAPEGPSTVLRTGSATWIARRDRHWWVGFAHYDGRGGEPGKGTQFSRVVVFDDEWRYVTAYRFPDELVQRFRPYSNSGGAWRADAYLYATGHSAQEMYVLRLPTVGSVFELAEIVQVPIAGQGIDWDLSEPWTLYGIDKDRREVIVMKP